MKRAHENGWNSQVITRNMELFSADKKCEISRKSPDIRVQMFVPQLTGCGIFVKQWSGVFQTDLGCRMASSSLCNTALLWISSLLLFWPPDLQCQIKGNNIHSDKELVLTTGVSLSFILDRYHAREA
ncbi:hypothetical protein TNCV_4314911 [Trichonephila clavipes]|nr:hypothetical protein TNCV_4314911 [Trichonephila clavipes]